MTGTRYWHPEPIYSPNPTVLGWVITTDRGTLLETPEHPPPGAGIRLGVDPKVTPPSTSFGNQEAP